MIVKKMNYRGFPELDFTDLNSWEAFNEILTILERDFQIKVLQQTEGPESRLCTFEMQGYKFLLCNEPDGNSIRSLEKDREIYIDWLKFKLE